MSSTVSLKRYLTPYFLPNSDQDNTTIDAFTTLREAVDLANAVAGPDQIIFDNSLANQTINIQLGNLVLTERVTITGPSAGLVFINDASATADTGLTFSI